MLRISRSEVAREIEERIGLGEALLEKLLPASVGQGTLLDLIGSGNPSTKVALLMRSGPAVASNEICGEVKVWADYNEQLLSARFTTRDEADAYRQNRHGDSPISKVPTIQDLGNSLSRQITHLRSVLERLPLFEEGTAESEGGDKRAVPERDSPILQRQGATWLITFEGETKSVPHSIGLLYIAHLLQNEGREIDASTLRAIAQDQGQATGKSVVGQAMKGGNIVEPGEGSLDGRADEQALKQYRQRLRDIRAEKDKADTDNDLGRAQRLTEEEEILLAEIGRSTRPGHRSRAPTDRDKDRKAVSKAIDRALGKIRSHHAPFYKHLDGPLEKGLSMSYRPDPPVGWAVET